MKRHMKKQFWLGTACAAVLAAAVADEVKPPPVYYQVPPVLMAPPATSADEQYVYDQKPLPQQPMLITPQQAQEIVDRFRTNYPKLESPRVLIYVNRDLVDDKAGLKLSSRTEVIETKQGTAASTGTNAPGQSTSDSTVVKNNYSNEPKAATALADRQTVRDVERLFGRPLRLAGVILVDEHIASQLIGDRPLQELASGTTGTEASKDREAISQIADVAIEVLISSRNVTVQEVSGDKTYTVPDIQATAIRLKDSKIIGQASATDVINHNPGFTARNFGVQDITEATALALMDDILQTIQ
jgi:hypothetical protein